MTAGWRRVVKHPRYVYDDWRTRHERLDLRHLRRLLGPNVSTIVELGANDGADTLRLHRRFPAARVCCFEPDPRALALLRDRVGRRPIEVYPMAVGAHDGTAVFHQSSGTPPTGQPDEGGWHRSGSIREPLEHLTLIPWVTFDRTITVPVTTLDTWAAEHDVHSIDFIWADVQGAEVDLIAGGRHILRHTRFLYTEYSNTQLYAGQADLDGILQRLPDWTIEARFACDVLLRNRAFAG